MLERLFLIERLPPWHSNRLNRLIKTPKLHLGDTGVGCSLLGLNPAALAKDRALFGQFLETFVLQELKRQSVCQEIPLSFFHYRDKDKAEVDIVIERGATAVAGVEVKAAATVTPADFRGLHKLKRATGDRFASGVNNCSQFSGFQYAMVVNGQPTQDVLRLWCALLTGAARTRVLV